MSRFSKRVLIDQAELDRLRARQLREYSPEIQTMARLQDQIINILDREDLTAEEKLSMISSSDSRFSKLRGQTQILPAIVPPTQMKPETKHEGVNDQDLQKEHEAIAKPAPETDTPTPPNEIQLNILKASQNRAFKVLSKITNNPQILSRTGNGELSFLGKPIPNSSFDTLMESAYIPNSNTNIVGIDEFMKGLRLIHVTSAELSATSFKNIYKPTSPQYHPAARKNIQLAPVELQAYNVPGSPIISTARHQAYYTKPQSGKGVFSKSKTPHKIGSPLAKRAKILYVY